MEIKESNIYLTGIWVFYQELEEVRYKTFEIIVQDNIKSQDEIW